MIKVTLPDGSIKDFELDIVTPLDVALNISKGLTKKLLLLKLMESLLI